MFQKRFHFYNRPKIKNVNIFRMCKMRAYKYDILFANGLVYLKGSDHIYFWK